MARRKVAAGEATHRVNLELFRKGRALRIMSASSSFERLLSAMPRTSPFFTQTQRRAWGSVWKMMVIYSPPKRFPWM